MSSRSWSVPMAGLIAGLAISVLAGACTRSEPERPSEPAKAAETAAESARPEAAKPTAIPILVDELYVDAEAEPDEGSPPLTVMFTSIVEDYTGDYTCEWDFGDGSPKSTELNPKHVYEKEGDFIVLLTCKDSKGIQGETEIDVTVYNYD